MPEAIQLTNIYDSFMQLGERVHVTLRTQLGDIGRLNAQKADARHKSKHLNIIPPGERLVIEASVDRMVQELDTVTTVSSDPPDASPITLGSHVQGGMVGRPSIDILPSDLADLSSGRVSRRHLAELYHCHPRTIRRRLLEFNLSPPGPPIYVDEQQPGGIVNRTYHRGSSSDLSTITDAELDRLILELYHQFPLFGRWMHDSYLLQLGYRIPCSRTEASYLQLVIHGFIDGFSCYVLGMRVSNNNRSETVLSLFEDIAMTHGYPSRVRVCPNYIYRSVHNIRIERLWVDVTNGIGQKWKEFFQTLEAYDNLNVNNVHTCGYSTSYSSL
ncbi:hypothetical protein BDR04DRAFT_1036922 [Suillus decipiens]|nr:hypothetical protein BDR04DRAFT_1036922 [Suillus decipiens]